MLGSLLKGFSVHWACPPAPAQHHAGAPSVNCVTHRAEKRDLAGRTGSNSLEHSDSRFVEAWRSRPLRGYPGNAGRQPTGGTDPSGGAPGLRDARAKAEVARRLRRLAFGNPGGVKPVGEDVSELRTHCGPGYRVYYIQRGSLLTVLLCGGDKSARAGEGGMK